MLHVIICDSLLPLGCDAAAAAAGVSYGLTVAVVSAVLAPGCVRTQLAVAGGTGERVGYTQIGLYRPARPLCDKDFRFLGSRNSVETFLNSVS